MKKQDEVITPAKIRSAAMDLLTGREFSRAELAKKLDKRFDSDPAIASELDRLQEEGLQSDQRFTEAFLRSRIYRGHGLARIRLDVRQKGIGDDLFNAAVEATDTDWFRLAREVADRKFGRSPATEQKDRARRMRFLQYRGFNFDQIKYALSATDAEDF
ncbi:recombination regulator RecX [Porticoccaceae bacterium]|jgi:regulatory protein|nr:regulatory protein RecX [Porticoccaceae bacterium]MDA7816479.1 recombination regulator RecX [Porticoccaceae bacterium]MDB2319667.1 recombination regulator RecX [Porticoccaceae bacterium]